MEYDSSCLEPQTVHGMITICTLWTENTISWKGLRPEECSYRIPSAFSLLRMVYEFIS